MRNIVLSTTRLLAGHAASHPHRPGASALPLATHVNQKYQECTAEMPVAIDKWQRYKSEG